MIIIKVRAHRRTTHSPVLLLPTFAGILLLKSDQRLHVSPSKVILKKGKEHRMFSIEQNYIKAKIFRKDKVSNWTHILTGKASWFPRRGITGRFLPVSRCLVTSWVQALAVPTICFRVVCQTSWGVMSPVQMMYDTLVSSVGGSFVFPPRCCPLSCWTSSLCNSFNFLPRFLEAPENSLSLWETWCSSCLCCGLERFSGLKRLETSSLESDDNDDDGKPRFGIVSCRIDWLTPKRRDLASFAGQSQSPSTSPQDLAGVIMFLQNKFFVDLEIRPQKPDSVCKGLLPSPTWSSSWLFPLSLQQRGDGHFISSPSLYFESKWTSVKWRNLIVFLDCFCCFATDSSL